MEFKILKKIYSSFSKKISTYFYQTRTYQLKPFTFKLLFCFNTYPISCSLKYLLKKKKKLFIILRKISIYFYPNQLLNPLSNSNLSTKATVFFLLINYYIFIFHNKIIQNLDKHTSLACPSL